MGSDGQRPIASGRSWGFMLVPGWLGARKRGRGCKRSGRGQFYCQRFVSRFCLLSFAFAGIVLRLSLRRF